MRHQRHKILLLTLMIVMLLVAGCAARTTVPDDHFYQLPDILPAKSLANKQINAIISVGPIRSVGLYGERAILYIDSNSPLEIHRYHYHHWAASPPRLIQESLLEYLRASKFASNVERYDSAKQVDGTIRGTLLHFERISSAEGIKVDVALELAYNNPKQHQTWHKEYHATLPVKDSSLHTTVEGFGLALQQIFDTFAADLQQSQI